MIFYHFQAFTIPSLQEWIMGTYQAGQALIALAALAPDTKEHAKIQ